MHAVSSRYLAALRRPHTLAVRVDLMFAGEVTDAALYVDDGSVTLDRGAAQLGRLDLTLAEPTRLPLGPSSLLTPYGYELAVHRGIDFRDGSAPELHPLGVFPIQVSDVDGVTLSTTITASDRSQRVTDAGFEDDEQIPPGFNYADGIQALIANAVPGLVFLFASTPYVTPLLTFTPGMDRWVEAQKMARHIGMELYFDGLGRCVLRPEPDVRTAVPVWEVDDGADGVLVSARVRLDRGPAFNRAIVFGTNASIDIVPRGVATDDDPSSPTYYYGPFGRKPRRFGSPFTVTNDQANTAAGAILASNLGIAKSVDLSAIPNAALEAGDPIRVIRPALELNEVHLADVLTIGLGPESVMPIASRARQEAAA